MSESDDRTVSPSTPGTEDRQAIPEFEATVIGSQDTASSPHPSAKSDSSHWIGKSLGKYQVTRVLGRGGMGVVLQAHDPVIGRDVAIKVLADHLAADSTALGRFLVEAKTAGQINHPNVAAIHDAGQEGEARFLVMELVPGGSLAGRLEEQGPLSVLEATRALVDACRGIGSAHAASLIHRDIKPDNFLITPAGKLKLSDFGLASVMAGRRITAAGKTMGTIRYMAPEQIAGQPVGPQTDLYSFGCVLFEMLVGHPPFTGKTQAETLQMHLKAPVPRITAESPDVPPGLEELVQNLLEKKAANRPPDAAEVGRRLRAISPVIAVRSGQPTTGISSRPTEVTRKSISASAETADALSARTEPLTVPVRLERALQAAVLVTAVLLVTVMLLMNGRANRQAARQQWIDAFTQPGPVPVRVHAAAVLGQIGRGEKEIVDLLTGGIDDPDPEVRAAAVKALAQLQGDARSAVGRLIKTQKSDDDTKVRVAATFALESIRDGENATGHWRNWILLTLVGLSTGAIVWQIGRWCAAARRTGSDD